MIPDITDPRWKNIVTGKIQHQFGFIPAGMCVSRHVRAVAKDNSAASVNNAVTEIHQFFAKYEQLELVANDLKAIFG